jgi:serine protease Do
LKQLRATSSVTVLVFIMHNLCIILTSLIFLIGSPVCAVSQPLVDTIARVKPSIVGLGTVQKTRRPPNILRGTGFVVADVLHVITNAHIISEKLAENQLEYVAVFAGQGKSGSIRPAITVAVDKDHDLCLLKINGPPLPAMNFGDDQKVREGQLYAFTGYPLVGILGLYASTSQGIISAITPIVIPVHRGRQINYEIVQRLQQPYEVFQLDAIAYPGNSGSPLYDVETGLVIGIINMVFVKGTKEHAVSDPSGITYAIPAHYAQKLIKDAGLKARNP